MENKLIELAKKLKQLSIQGVDGEKDNAKQKLDLIMRKYKISESMLEEEVLKERFFTVKKNDEKITIQIILSVVDRPLYKIRGKKAIIVELTDFEYIEVSEKIEFYTNKYHEDLEIFYAAFIHKNELWKKNSEELKSTKPDIEQFRKMKRMMAVMDAHKLQKKLN